MKEDKLVPKRRFNEFENSEAWEQRKLGEVANFSKGRGYSKNDLTEEGTPIILYGSLYTNYQTVINEVNTFTVDKVNSVYSLGNEVVVPSSGESAEDIARASAIANKGIILGGDLNIIYPNENINSIFLATASSFPIVKVVFFKTLAIITGEIHIAPIGFLASCILIRTSFNSGNTLLFTPSKA